MEIYPDKMKSTHEAHDAVYMYIVHFFGEYLYPPKTYYSHSLKHFKYLYPAL